MSAWIVSKKTIDSILSSDTFRNLFNSDFNRERILDSDSYKTRIGQGMWNMNYEAVNQRYGQKEKAPNYKFSSIETSEIQAYKNLNCLLYQCSEGDVPEKWLLYKRLRWIEGRWAGCIIDELPEYQQAEWGMD